ncbi:MAG: acyltransferase [Lachnospiraceae bacterium]|nr:acyltransferase [Lachnospiraceae bacterium]
MKEKKNYLDILRIVAIFMVFHFHFVIVLGQQQGLLFGFANGDWGCVGTTLFFLISGNCLARNYGEKLEVRKFYWKRWLSIFPAFYLCYVLVLFGHTVLLKNQVLAGVEPWRIIFTLLGIDNYLNFVGIRNAALVGEWYTAIILCIYLLFPLLQFLYRKSKLIGTLLVVGLYVLNILFTWGPFPDDAHLITGVCMFWIGMLLYHFEKFLEKMPWYLWIGVLLCSLMLFFVEVVGPQLLRKNVMAICIFLLLMRVGVCFKRESVVIRFLSKIEYGIYLCHHTVIYVLQAFFLKLYGEVKTIPYYCMCLVASIVFAALITYLTQWIVKKLSTRKALSA